MNRAWKNGLIAGIGLLLWICQGPVAVAQEEKENNPQPQLPLVGPALARAGWTISCSSKKKIPSKPEDPKLAEEWEYNHQRNPQVVEIRVVKEGKNRADITELSNGKRRERWLVRDVVYSCPETFVAGDFMMMDIGADPNLRQSDVLKDFPELFWLDLKCFKGVETVDRKKCYLYIADSGIPSGMAHADAFFTGIDLSKGPVKAWIDMKSNLPVAIETEDCLCKYSFLSNIKFPSPTGAIANAIKNNAQAK
jgi:hypothetical protein